jgi:hypothetical protein
MEEEKLKGKRPLNEIEDHTHYNTPAKKSKTTPQTHSAEDHKKNNQENKRKRGATKNPATDKLYIFSIITNKVITMLKYKGTKALDELAGSNKGKIRLMSRANEKTYKKGKRNGSIFRAERVNTIHQMTIEEARTTEVSISKTERGRYGNAHIRYDINDGLVDVILEVIPTEEQKTERTRKQKEKKDQRNMSKEEEHEIKEKYRPRSEEDA